MTIDEAKEFLQIDIHCADKGDEEDMRQAMDMAIASLEAWDKVKQEINDLFSKPACYMPNYDAYKMFLYIIDKHLQEVDK